jgi:hypothetical protein
VDQQAFAADSAEVLPKVRDALINAYSVGGITYTTHMLAALQHIFVL